MRYLLTLAILLAALATPARGQEPLHVLQLDEFSLQTGRIVDFDDPYFPYANRGNAHGEFWDTITQVNFNLDLFKYDDWGLYWDNNVAGASTDTRYRMVQWHWEGGLDLDKYAQIFWEHQSTHILDAPGGGHFPMFNAYECRIVIYRRGRD